ncbi:hypothetical protein DFO73_10940 [Cytobacillus oceanisediminis]|jgi:hypothetical protein|uniref:Uncharacterized protein n=1 Tax=Cytobacillus oceanisediminis TaxID=665099 RepID=A0A2V2ZT74_9BACI|nr:hypothetical protein DFO73_10940 [Cytobacillus oceanisediminis]
MFIGDLLIQCLLLLKKEKGHSNYLLFNNPKAWIITGAILLSVFIGKASAPIIISKFYRYSKTEQNVMIGLTIPQAAATLASTLYFSTKYGPTIHVNKVIIMTALTVA